MPERDDDIPGGRAFWLTNAIGMGIVAFGLWGLLGHADQTRPWNWLKFVGGSVVLHDALWAPAVGLASLVLVRVVPARIRPILQGTLVVTVAVLLVATPVLTGRGRIPNNPSILPGDYGPDTLKVLAAVWLGGLVVGALAWRRPATATDPARAPDLPPARPGW
jgi:hypothetical protein